MTNEEDYSDYAWVIRGSQKKKILSAINKPKIPTELKNDTSLSLNNVSDILREFKKKKLVKCLNPNEKTGRLYQLTPKGMRIKEMLNNSK